MQRGLSLALIGLLAGLPAVPAHAQMRSQQAGTLISADPIRDAPPGMQAWKVTYRTTSQEGRPLQVTGIVAAPREAPPQRPRRVLAWTHGAWPGSPGPTASIRARSGAR